MGDVCGKVGAHLLEIAQLGNILQQRHRADGFVFMLQGRYVQPDEPVPRRCAHGQLQRHQLLVLHRLLQSRLQTGVAGGLQHGLSHSGAGHAQHVLCRVVHLHHAQLSIHRDQTIDHVIDDGFQLHALVLQLFHGVLQPRVHGAQGAQQLPELRVGLNAGADVVVAVDDGLRRRGDLVDGRDHLARQRVRQPDAHRQQQRHQRGKQAPVAVAEHGLVAREPDDAAVRGADRDGHLHLREPSHKGDLLPRAVRQRGDDVGLVKIEPHLSTGVKEDLPVAGHVRDARAEQAADLAQLLLLPDALGGILCRLPQVVTDLALLLLHGQAHREEARDGHHGKGAGAYDRNDAAVHGSHASCSLSTKR